MQDSESEHKASVGEMRKDRETMADGRRYIIYYTFKKDAEKMSNDIKPKAEERENV